MRATIRFLLPLATAALVACAGLPGESPALNQEALRPESPDGSELLANLPLSFVENRGQVDPRAPYYLQGAESSVYFTAEGLRLSLAPSTPNAPGWSLALDFVGAEPTVPESRSKAEGTVSYFKGDPGEWRSSIPIYSRVLYRDLWPGIDLVYSGTGAELKYAFRVAPGADPSRIRLHYRGATGLRLTPAGALEVSTPARTFTDAAPVSWQPGGAEVETAYAVDGRTYEFDLGAYDPSRALVIDPAMLLYAGYIGGSAIDAGSGIAVDSAGNAYVAGATTSTEATFPDAVGPDLTHNGGYDAFVAKVNAGGTSLVYAGYIGGSGTEVGTDIAVDSAGNAYVAGGTTSTEATFPEAVGPDLTHNGGNDAFVARVDAGGASLGYAGYIGGSADDQGLGIALDSVGTAYVTGSTLSTEATFPEAVGPDLTHNGGVDAFVARVDAGGATLGYAGYIGGTGFDAGAGIALDPAGNAYVGGFTNSTEATFPEAVGPDLTHNGSTDGFVARVNAGGATLAYAGYIGGSGADLGNDVAVDSSGNAHVAGHTESNEATFPEAVGPDLAHNGATDAFVARVNAGGTSLDYAGYIGGSGDDQGYGIALDLAGNAYITGYAESTEATFPEAVGPDLTHNGASDAFVARVNAGGTSLGYAGYIGGSGEDEAHAIAVDGGGNAYVTGWTASSEATFPEAVGPDLTHNGGDDGFVAKVEGTPEVPGSPGSPGSPTVSASSKSVGLSAKPKKVLQGKKTKLTAVVSPCAGHEGDSLQLLRKGKVIVTKPSNTACTALFKVKMKKTATFQAVSPQQDADHLEGRSKTVTVKVKKPTA